MGASRFEENAAEVFERSFLATFGETVTRRIGGDAARTEPVDACVDFDEKNAATVATDRGTMLDNQHGQYTDVAGLLDIPVGQQTTPDDTWVIDGEVYKQLGGPIGIDDGCQTIVVLKRKGQRSRLPKTTTT